MDDELSGTGGEGGCGGLTLGAQMLVMGRQELIFVTPAGFEHDVDHAQGAQPGDDLAVSGGGVGKTQTLFESGHLQVGFGHIDSDREKGRAWQFANIA